MHDYDYVRCRSCSVPMHGARCRQSLFPSLLCRTHLLLDILGGLCRSLSVAFRDVLRPELLGSGVRVRCHATGRGASHGGDEPRCGLSESHLLLLTLAPPEARVFPSPWGEAGPIGQLGQ